MEVFGRVVVARAVAQAVEFFSVVGEVVNWCGPGTSMPLSGSAHINAAWNIHFGISVHGTVPTTCTPGWYQGTINGPTFNSGAGFLRNEGGSELAVTFTRVACPPLPQ